MPAFLYLLVLASSLTGTVMDEAKRPVRGAVVILLPSGGLLLGEDPPSTTSDENGRYQVAIQGVAPFRAEAYAPGYAPFRVREVDLQKPLAIVLETGGEVIEGVLRDGGSLDPVEGAIVETRAAEAAARLSSNPRLGLIEGVTNARGQFRLEGLGKESYTLSASAPGYGRAMKSEVEPGEAAEIYLFPGTGIYGRIVDEKGGPVEGALVSSQGKDTLMWRSPSTVQRSDSEGRFALLGLDPGAHRVFLRHDDFAPLAEDVELSKERDIEIELVLSVGTALSGRIVNQEDEPLSGKLTLRGLDGGPVSPMIRSRLSAETTEDGAFTLTSVPAGEHTLFVEAVGYGSKNVDVSVSGRARDQDVGDIVLEPGLAITGRVLDKAGAPVPGSRVMGFNMRRSMLSRTADENLEVYADTEGRFVIAGLEEGVYQIFATAPGFGRSDPVSAEPGKDAVRIELKPAGSIRGTVVDREGRAVSSYQVIARSPERRGFGGAQRVRDEAGVFVLESVAEGEYVVEIASSDFVSEAIPGVKVIAGNVTELGTIRLRRGGSIQGTVVDSLGEPVAGATLVVQAPGQRWLGHFENGATSDPQGRFRLGGIADGVVQLQASHPSYAPTSLDRIAVDSRGAPVEVDVVLSRGGALEGYVRSRDGTDIAGRTIQAIPFEDAFNVAWRASGTVQTSDDGYFRFDHLPPGRMNVLLVNTDMEIRYPIQSRDAEISEGETAFIEFQSRRVLVSGQARKGGASLSAVAIELWPIDAVPGISFSSMGDGSLRPPSSGPRYLSGITNEDGFFELLVDSPGKYHVRASAHGIGLPSREVEIPDVDSFSLDLDFGGATVSGRVIDKETEAPIVGAFVTARPADPSRSAGFAGTQVGADGSFELDVEPGDYVVSCRAERYATDEKKIRVAQGAPAELEFALSSGIRLSGRILDSSGRGLGNQRVFAVEDSPDIRSMSMTMGINMSVADGSFVLDQLPPGRFNLLAGSELVGFAFASAVAAGTEDVELVLRPGGRVEVQVVDKQGAAVPKAIVGVAAIDGHRTRGVQSSTDANGRVVVTVPRGNLTIKAAVMNGPEGMGAVSVSENATARIEIVVSR